MSANSSKLMLRLYGPFSLLSPQGEAVHVGSVKQKVILALLATAPEGRRSRSFLENMLWSMMGKEQAQGNLRQAVMTLRRVLNAETEVLFADKGDVWIDRSQLVLLGEPTSGEFLEGLNLPYEKRYCEWVAERRREQYHSSLIDASNLLRPSIAILPFKTIATSAETVGLSDMVAENLIHTLSKSNLINVISHLSTTSFNGGLNDLGHIRDALKSDYIVTGRMMVLDKQITLQTEITHCQSGIVKNSSSVSFPMKEFLASGSETILEICAMIGRTLFVTSVDQVRQTQLGDIACHDLMMAGIFQMHRQNLRWFSEARERLEEVARRVPNSSLPQAWLSKWYILSVLQGWSNQVEADHIASAKEHADRALQLNPICSFSHTIDGFVHNNLLKNYDIALSRFDEALAIEPNNPLSWLLKGTLLAFTNQGEAAVTCTNRAQLLSPLDPHKYFYDSLSATAALSNKNHESALELANCSLAANRNHVSTQRVKTIALYRLGREEEARESADVILKLDDGFTIEKYLHNHPAANFDTGRDWADALRASGIPDA